MFLTVTPNMVVSKTAPTDTTKLWWDAQPVDDSLSTGLLFQTGNPDLASSLGVNTKMIEVVTTTSSLKQYNSGSKAWTIVDTLVGYPITVTGYTVYKTSAEAAPSMEEPIVIYGPDGMHKDETVELILSNYAEWGECEYTLSATNCEHFERLIDDYTISFKLQNATGPVVVTLDMETMAPVMLEGADQTTDVVKSLSFRSSAPLDEFECVNVNGNQVDPKYYNVKEGSTIVTLRKEFTANLPNGTNTIDVVSSRGVATAEFHVQYEDITFNLCGTDYTAKKGMTWGDWIVVTSSGASTGNGILWVGFDGKTIYYDVNYPNHTIARPGENDTIYQFDSYYNIDLDTKQSVGDLIVDGMIYGVHEECCFDAGSPVLMADGTTKNIEDIVVGDMVMSLDETTNSFVAQEVENTITKHNSDDLVYVNLSNGEKIGMRAYHPLLTVAGWKSLRPTLADTIADVGHVEMLEVGDVLVGYEEDVTVISIESREHIENYDTYNLSIVGYPNYIVHGVVVHNADCPC